MKKMLANINGVQININSASVAVILGLLPLLFLAQLPNKSLQLGMSVIFCLFWFIPFYLTKFVAILGISFLWGCWQGYYLLEKMKLFSQQQQRYVAIIEDSLVNRDNHIRIKVRLLINNNKQSFPILYAYLQFKPNTLSKNNFFCAGQKLIFSGQLKPIHSLLNEGGFDIQRYAINQRLLGTFKVQNFTILNKHCSLRQQIIAISASVISKYHNQAVIYALMFGERGLLDPVLRQQLQQTGIAHLMAISGLHIGMAYFFGFWLSRLVQFLLPTYFIKPRIPMLVGWCFALGYAWVSGWAIPAMRATFALSLWLYIRQQNFVCFPWQWALWSITLILVVEPLAILADSFWLSSFAVAALIFWFSFVKLSVQFQHSWLNWLAKLVHLQLGMLILLIPIQLILFQGVNIASFWANLWAVPIISFITIPLIMLSYICIFGHTVQNLLFDIIDKSISLVLWPLSHIERYWLDTGPLPIIMTGISWLIILCWQFGWFVQYKLLITLLIYWSITTLKQSDLVLWRLIMLDVGHGLAIVIEQQGKVLIYDTGIAWKKNSIANSTILPYLRYHRLIPEGVILSHNHIDHTGGLASLLLTYPGLVIRSHFDKENHFPCHRGIHWQWQRLYFEVLWPIVDQKESHNNESCVVKISDGHHSVILSGDIEKAAEKELVRLAIANLSANLLQVPHHGSNTSSTMAFIQAIKPQYALTSVARYSRWRLPSDKVRQRYVNMGANWLNTAESGQIIAQFYSDKIEIMRYRHELYPRWYHQQFGI